MWSFSTNITKKSQCDQQNGFFQKKLGVTESQTLLGFFVQPIILMQPTVFSTQQYESQQPQHFKTH